MSKFRKVGGGLLSRPLVVGICAFVLITAAVVAGVAISASSTPTAAKGPVRIDPEQRALSPILQRKLGTQKFAPGEPAIEAGENEWNDGAQEFFQHAYPLADVPLASLEAASKDWKALKVRGNSAAKLGENGKWTNMGPDNAVYPLNQFRNRGVYVPNEYVASGRTPFSLIDPNCGAVTCRLWIANAGGGIWRTNNAFAAQPAWEYISPEFEHNNTAALELDPNDPTSSVLYAGTGEPNTCRSGCLAGIGMYKSKDGGDHWSGPIGREYFSGRGIGAIEVKPGDSNTIFVATGAHGSRGISSTCCNGVDRGAGIPGAPHFGLYRSTDGGDTFTLVNQGNTANCTGNTPTEVFNGQTACSPRGARRVKVDPLNPNTVYAAFYAKGIWRSTQNGDPGTWEQIFAPVGLIGDAPTGAGIERAEFDVVALPNGDTRMYVGVGGGVTQTGASIAARFYRSDLVQTGTPAWTNLTNNTSTGYCDPQCNYDNYVYVPKKADGTAHNPDTVYLLGSFAYGEVGSGQSNGRAILLSTNAGASFDDMSYDATSNVQPHGVHPDQHSIVTNPADWKQFIETSDGGLIRSNGNFVDDSADCVNVFHLTGNGLARCQAVTDRIPEVLQSINKGLNTLHFYQVAFNPNRPGELAGGAQDNGSWMKDPNSKTWVETYVADGTYNGFDAVDPNYSSLSWQSGALAALDQPRNQEAPFWIADTLRTTGAAPFRYNREVVPFSVPTQFHQTIGKLMFTSREHVFRSLNGGVNPNFPYSAVKTACNLWTGDGDIDGINGYVPSVDVCDDWKAMGDPGHLGRLTYGPLALCPPAGTPTAAWTVACPAPYPWGDDRSGGHISTIQASQSDGNVVWTATSAGRVFVTTNALAADPATIAWHRIDTSSDVDPGRYVTDIYVDTANPNHAFITYSGYNQATPLTPGHVFEVVYNPATSTATFTNLDGAGNKALGDLPVGTVAYDEARDTLYIGTDFGIATSKGGDAWNNAHPGLPTTTIPYLLIDQKNRILYVTTHGFGAWMLKLS